MCPNRVAISFAATAEQIEQVRRVLKEIWPGNRIEIICKIESRLGLKNIDILLENADGIMIARGDLKGMQKRALLIGLNCLMLLWQ